MFGFDSLAVWFARRSKPWQILLHTRSIARIRSARRLRSPGRKECRLRWEVMTECLFLVCKDKLFKSLALRSYPLYLLCFYKKESQIPCFDSSLLSIENKFFKNLFKTFFTCFLQINQFPVIISWYKNGVCVWKKFQFLQQFFALMMMISVKRESKCIIIFPVFCL